VSRPALTARNVTRGTVLAEQLEDGRSFWSKFMGLMGRASLPSGAGLWMPGENGIHMLFMRFAIDVVFVAPPDGTADGSRKVVAVRRAVKPWTGVVWRVGVARGILELPVGTIDASATALGDEITIEPRTAAG
jgi:uncharacterized membrane protein (UPF0127 family)